MVHPRNYLPKQLRVMNKEINLCNELIRAETVMSCPAYAICKLTQKAGMYGRGLTQEWR